MTDSEQSEQADDASAVLAVIWEIGAQRWQELMPEYDRVIRHLADDLLANVAGCEPLGGPTLFLRSMRREGDQTVECPADECELVQVRMEIRVRVSADGDLIT